MSLTRDPKEDGKQLARELKDRGVDLNDPFAKQLRKEEIGSLLLTPNEKERFIEGYNSMK